VTVQLRKVGDKYPPITFGDEHGNPLDLSGCEVFYSFVPDDKRAKVHRNEPLRLLDAKQGVVEAPVPRAVGWAELQVHFPDGTRWTPMNMLRWVR
jgi:hypothetical protein